MCKKPVLKFVFVPPAVTIQGTKKENDLMKRH